MSDVVKLLSKILISAAIIVGAFMAGYLYKDAPEKIKIVKETETKFEYIKIATTEKELLECYRSNLEIFATVQNDNWVEIIAKDECKKSTKSIKINIENKKNFIYTNIGYKTINVNYYRKFGNILVGGGVGYPGIINVGIGYNF